MGTPASNQTDSDLNPIVLKRVKESKACEITEYFDLLTESIPLLTEEQTPSEFLQRLMKQGHYYDAVSFLAHAMPAKQSIYWACQCIQEHLEHSDTAEQHAYHAAKTWLYDPTETHRFNAEHHAEAGSYNTPASWIAAAVFWSGGNIAPKNEPTLIAAPYLYAKAIQGSIVMSAGLHCPAQSVVQERYQQYLALGVKIANGQA
jgi:hypothetical protein